MRHYLYSTCLLALSCGPPGDEPSATGGSSIVAEPTTFVNPVVDHDCPDPGVLRTGDHAFVMVCTGGGFRIRTSPDLVHWTDSGKSIFPDGKPPWAANGRRDWAPEIHRLAAGRFVAYFTAADAHDRLAVGAASATDPLGPWTATDAPLVTHDIGAIDPTFFADDDGKKYLYWKVDGNQRPGGATPIMARELAADGLSFAEGSVAVEVFDHGAAWEGPLVEAPWVVKRDGAYFMFYSGNVYDDRYRTGVARASSPLGTFARKQPVAPILGNDAAWVGPGHGSIVTVGGTDWYVHHAWKADDRAKGRVVLLDRVVWGDDGWPSFRGGASAVGREDVP